MKRLSFNVLSIVLAGTKACQELFRPIFSCRGDEVMLVALLNEQGLLLELLGGRGDRDSVSLDFSRVLRRAVKMKAEGLIIAHNHPSGDERPSRSDKVMTARLAAQCEALSITLVDHMIFGEAKKSYSMRQHGLL